MGKHQLGASAQSDHIADKLAPQVKKSTNGVTKLILTCWGNNALLEVVVDLVLQFVLKFLFKVVWVRDA